MLTTSPIKSSKDAALYFEKDNYYTQEEGIKHSAWYGKAAETLQLSGKPVDPEEFLRFMDGNINGTQLGKITAEGRQHRPGWDLTFSAPKSVSILSEVYGRTEVREAHIKAVKRALDYVESRAAITRLKEGDSIKRVNTYNAMFATFTHDVSRELDPQLHTHSVMINATMTDRGWRSLNTEELYKLNKKAGMVYRSALAIELHKLAYTLRQHHASPEFFEVEGVPQAMIDNASQRAEQIRAYFKDKSIAYDPKLAKQIALITRKAKKSIDREELLEAWHTRFDKFTVEPAPHRSLKDSTSVTSHDPKSLRRIVRRSIRHLLEKDMSFKEADLYKSVMKVGMGKYHYAEIEGEFNRLVDNGYLQRGRFHTDDTETPRWTTQKMKNMENDLIDFVARNKDVCQPLIKNPDRALRFLDKQGLNDQQLEALMKAVQSTSRGFAIQGDPGVGKTTTLRAYRKLLNKQGYDVFGFTPTYDTLNELTDSLQIKGLTVDMFLAHPEHRDLKQSGKEQVWFIDESSMLSTDKMNSLLTLAEQRKARIVLVGDHQQLEAVGPGRAFYQLQDAGIETAVIDKRLRQENEFLQDVVQKVMDKQYSSALGALSHNNDIIESGSESDSVQALANEWLSLSKKERDNTLIVAPTNEQRREVNNAIRNSLKSKREIGRLDYIIPILEDKHLTNQEKRISNSYKNGDVVRFSRDFKATSRKAKDHIAKGEYFDVVGFNHANNTLGLRSRKDKRTIYIDPITKGGNIKGGIQVFTETKMEFSKGDKVRWIDNSNKHGIKRNTEAVIQGIGRGYVRINTGDKSIKLDTHRITDRHFCHDYAKTAYGVQGKTEKRVLALMQSWRINTTNRRAFMVAVTRARDQVKLFTDSVSKLSNTLRERSGDNTEALTRPEALRKKLKQEQRRQRAAPRLVPLM